MNCPQCGAFNQEISRFCFRCGRPLVPADDEMAEKAAIVSLATSSTGRFNWFLTAVILLLFIGSAIALAYWEYQKGTQPVVTIQAGT